MVAPDKPIGALLQDAAADVASIVKNETRLAQTEIKENLHQAVNGAIAALLGAVQTRRTARCATSPARTRTASSPTRTPSRTSTRRSSTSPPSAWPT